MKSVDSKPILIDNSNAAGSVFKRPVFRLVLVLLLVGLAIIVRENGSLDSLGGQLQTFVTIFLSIFIEAVPFLLAGSIVSGLIEVFVNKDMLYRFVPKNPVLAAITGSSMGIIFPVCECGVVPVTRRLYQKGLPVSMGIAFLLAAPVVNPVVVASTFAAFGWGPMLWGRFALTLVIASVVGLIFYFAPPEDVLRPDTLDSHDHDHHHHHDESPPTKSSRVWESLGIAGDDFFDMGRYLVVGCALAAAMQTLVPQQVLLTLGSTTLTSILAMMVLAFVLSVCSTVDAFLALAFVNTFAPASILAFLVFGPMVDIKSALMFLGVFRRRIVLYLILLPLMFTLFFAVLISLNVRW